MAVGSSDCLFRFVEATGILVCIRVVVSIPMDYAAWRAINLLSVDVTLMPLTWVHWYPANRPDIPRTNWDDKSCFVTERQLPGAIDSRSYDY